MDDRDHSFMEKSDIESVRQIHQRLKKLERQYGGTAPDDPARESIANEISELRLRVRWQEER